MLRRTLLRNAAAGLALPPLLATPSLLPLASRNAHAAESAEAVPVDVELVLAVDVSRSVDPEEQELQFRGYESAFRDPALIDGLGSGPLGAIAVSFFVWSDASVQKLLVPWAKLEDAASSHAFADAIAAASRQTYLYTSISAAIDYASGLFGQRFEGTRKVVDISGDGINNSGRPLAEARAEALDKGIVLNGLAVLDRQPIPPALAASLPKLDEYYRDEVIGGTGAFLVVADGFAAFDTAVKRKIIREIAANPATGPLMERFA